MGAVCEKRAGPKAADGDLQDARMPQVNGTEDKELSEAGTKPWPVFCGPQHLDTNDKMSEEHLLEVTTHADQGCHALGEEDSDGVMDQAKFLERLSAFAQGLSEARKGELVKMADQDADGNVSADEQRSFMSKLDRDGDGKLSAEELGVTRPSTVAEAFKPLAHGLTAMASSDVRPYCTALVDMSFAYVTGASVLQAGLKSAQKISERLIMQAVIRGFSSVWRRPVG